MSSDEKRKIWNAKTFELLNSSCLIGHPLRTHAISSLKDGNIREVVRFLEDTMVRPSEAEADKLIREKTAGHIVVLKTVADIAKKLHEEGQAWLSTN